MMQRRIYIGQYKKGVLSAVKTIPALRGRHSVDRSWHRITMNTYHNFRSK